MIFTRSSLRSVRNLDERKAKQCNISVLGLREIIEVTLLITLSPETSLYKKPLKLSFDMNVKFTYLTTLGWFNSFSKEISLMAVLGTPSDSLKTKSKFQIYLNLPPSTMTAKVTLHKIQIPTKRHRISKLTIALRSVF